MFLDIEERKGAARGWLDVYAAKSRNGEQDKSKAEHALAIILLAVATSDFLAESDPQALKQGQEALDGTSWQNYPHPKTFFQLSPKLEDELDVISPRGLGLDEEDEFQDVDVTSHDG